MSGVHSVNGLFLGYAFVFKIELYTLMILAVPAVKVAE